VKQREEWRKALEKEEKAKAEAAERCEDTVGPLCGKKGYIV